MGYNKKNITLITIGLVTSIIILYFIRQWSIVWITFGLGIITGILITEGFTGSKEEILNMVVIILGWPFVLLIVISRDRYRIKRWWIKKKYKINKYDMLDFVRKIIPESKDVNVSIEDDGIHIDIHIPYGKNIDHNMYSIIKEKVSEEFEIPTEKIHIRIHDDWYI